MPRRLNRVNRIAGVIAAVAILAAAASACGGGDGDDAREALKIGLLIDLSGGAAEVGAELRLGFELAIEQLNEAGGVFGQPVEFVIADTTLDPTTAVSEAERLIEVERVHAIVGGIASAISIAVAESVTGPSGVPQITPVSSSPQVALTEDGDFLFRTTANDLLQGPILAGVTAEQGWRNVGVVYRDDAWGQGMADAFLEAWPHEATALAVDPGQASYLSELRQSARGGVEGLVLLTFPAEAETILREAIEHEVYDRFTFSHPARSFALIEAIGAEHLAGMVGTGPGTAPGTESAEAWEAAFAAAHGRPARFPWVKQTYDATVALALAAAAAQSTDGAAIRDQLRAVGGSPGLVVIAEPESLRAGLEAAAEGEEIDFEGSAQSLEWDAAGDLESGYMGVWEFTADGGIDDLRVIAY